ncbi:tyrosine-protein phosphatase [Actinoplanes xinjiangensis]|uniref:Tyrosine phosphatase family protein n=1 Tax=Actinoplanes xinjiangensis TaxID=512350 RepID=A0A316FCE7_9ACTN|nr:tyrosine-protein phosphatase [Actinoplanes xinjiangensis]PWK44147.1 tyrosine phosphatase family protein [Actinoplanes xinjiangensis]GIF38097.1 protein-tyrosine-phosphatase [Actinoplanes xinjiangensis]
MRLDWPGCLNARDLGGTPTRDGGRLRDNALIRSDSHALLTPAGIAMLRERPPALILDLRWPRECAEAPSPFAAEAWYRNLPLLADPLGYDPPDDTYAPMLDHNAERVAAAVHEIAAAPPGAVIIHCHGGRDRTGLLAAVLLGVAGVAPDDIAADYAATPGTDAAAMSHTLQHAETRYGGVEQYLLSHGVSAAEITTVRRRLVPGWLSPLSRGV